MAKEILDEVADEVFENVERQLKRTIESILNIPVSIGVPDARWKKQYGYPFGCVMIDSCKITDFIDDGSPESQTEEGDKVILECEICEADMILAFHLATRKKTIADRLAFKFIKGIRKNISMGIKRTSATIHPDEVVLPVPKRSKRHRFKTFRQRIDEVRHSTEAIYYMG